MTTNNQNTFFNFQNQNKVDWFDPGQTMDRTSGEDYSVAYADDETQKSFDFEPAKKATVFDVAAYILEKIGPLTTMKLHKLVYYCQAWSLVWDEQPLFDDKIEAWANGPVVRNLFAYHKGQYSVSNVSIGNPDTLNDSQKETIDSVLNFYGNKSSQWLIELTHMEDPWKKARIGLALTDRGDQEITYEAMAEYYSSL